MNGFNLYDKMKHELKDNSIVNYVKIRGDGNCFFRTMWAYIFY